MQNFSELSLKDQREQVWQNRNEIGMDNFLPFREIPNDSESKFRKAVELKAIPEEDLLANVLLYGESSYPSVDNCKIINASVSYILETSRFSVNLLEQILLF